MLTPGEGVKAGWHGVGPVVDPDARDFTPEPVQLEALRRYVREWLPGVDAEACEPISCTYTSTESEDFVLDRVGPVVIGAGFSGHGFKFTPRSAGSWPTSPTERPHPPSSPPPDSGGQDSGQPAGSPAAPIRPRFGAIR